MSTPNQNLKRLRRRARYLDTLIAEKRLPPGQQALCRQEREALAWALPLLETVVRSARQATIRRVRIEP